MQSPKSGTVKPDGERIKALRKQHGLELHEFAKRAGQSERNLQRIMAGENTTFNNLKNIAAVFDVPYDSLIYGSEVSKSARPQLILPRSFWWPEDKIPP